MKEILEDNEHIQDGGGAYVCQNCGGTVNSEDWCFECEDYVYTMTKEEWDTITWNKSYESKRLLENENTWIDLKGNKLFVYNRHSGIQHTIDLENDEYYSES